MTRIKEILNKIYLAAKTSKGLKKKTLNYSVFVLIASFFWFLNQLDQEFKDQINLPISYLNLPDSNIQTLQLPKTAKLTVQTSGYKLLEHYLSPNKSSIYVDFKHVELKHGISNIQYLLMQNIIQFNQSEYIHKMDISTVSPDTIKFLFEPLMSKKVPIFIQVDYEIASNKILKKLSCMPDSVIIEGPTSIVKKIKKVKTGALDLGKIELSEKKNIALKTIDLVTMNNSRTNISVEIEELSEKKLNIAIQHQLPLNYKLIPSTINVSFRAGLSHLKDLNKSSFIFTLDTISISEGSSTRKIELKTYPSEALNVSYSPHFVEVIEIKDE